MPSTLLASLRRRQTRASSLTPPAIARPKHTLSQAYSAKSSREHKFQSSMPLCALSLRRWPSLLFFCQLRKPASGQARMTAGGRWEVLEPRSSTQQKVKLAGAFVSMNSRHSRKQGSSHLPLLGEGVVMSTRGGRASSGSYPGFLAVCACALAAGLPECQMCRGQSRRTTYVYSREYDVYKGCGPNGEQVSEAHLHAR